MSSVYFVSDKHVCNVCHIDLEQTLLYLFTFPESNTHLQSKYINVEKINK